MPEPTLIRLLDTYQGVTPKWCHDRLAEGWDGIIQGAWSGGFAPPLYSTMQKATRQSLRNMRAEGGITCFYTNAAPWRTPQVWFDETMRAVGNEYQDCSRIFVDHELRDGALYTRPENVDEFIRLLRTLGKPVDGYSADWFLNTQVTAGLRITFDLDAYWYAAYDGQAVLGLPRRKMCARIGGKQYQGSTTIDGVSCDLNVFDGSLFRSEPRQEPNSREETDMFLVKLKDPPFGFWIVGPDGKRELKNGQAEADAYVRGNVPVVEWSQVDVDAVPDASDRPVTGTFTGSLTSK